MPCNKAPTHAAGHASGTRATVRDGRSIPGRGVCERGAQRSTEQDRAGQDSLQGRTEQDSLQGNTCMCARARGCAILVGWQAQAVPAWLTRAWESAPFPHAGWYSRTGMWRSLIASLGAAPVVLSVCMPTVQLPTSRCGCCGAVQCAVRRFERGIWQRGADCSEPRSTQRARKLRCGGDRAAQRHSPRALVSHRMAPVCVTMQLEMSVARVSGKTAWAQRPSNRGCQWQLHGAVGAAEGYRSDQRGLPPPLRPFKDAQTPG